MGTLSVESSTRTASGPLSDEESESVPAAKKRKKSKMHECDVCQKKFPRPSGLKTHMNTHNNERPFACGFPGCARTFGVRSNAKRHLRTHGVIPQSSTGSPPYVVDFSTPVVLQNENSGRGRQFKLRWMPPSSTTR
ncbi:hypothetical protein CPB83DRAFT_766940, partial [Crepidotus variabilis]